MKQTKYIVTPTSQFKKDVKRAKKRGLPLDLLKQVVTTLAMGEKLDDCYKDHALQGEWVGSRECHIQPDWLLVYRIDGNALILTLVQTGTHSDIFGQ